MLHRRSFIASGLLSSVTMANAFAAKGSTLQVRVTYAGSGTVDDAHKLYVALWDTPDFVKDASGTMPIALKFVTAKSAAAEFADLDKSPVYLSMAFDPSGKWDAQSEPPSGTSLGLYSTEPGVPAPVQLEQGKTTKIEATLDDSYKALARMPVQAHHQ
jgi:hypothetical protein